MRTCRGKWRTVRLFHTESTFSLRTRCREPCETEQYPNNTSFELFWELSAGSAMVASKGIHEIGYSTQMFHLVCVINRGCYVIRRETRHGIRSVRGICGSEPTHLWDSVLGESRNTNTSFGPVYSTACLCVMSASQ